MKVAKLYMPKTMSTKEISDMTGVRHDNVMRSIDELNKLSILTPQSEESEYKARGKPYKCWNLTKRDSLVLIARLSPEFTAAVIDRWQELENKESRRQQEAVSRSISKIEFKPMNTALEEARKELGKDTASHHYSNEADMINRIVTGKSAAQFRVFHGMEKDDSVRDMLSASQINAIVGLQRANMVYIQDGMLFDERKERLHSLYMRKFDAAIAAEINRLES